MTLDAIYMPRPAGVPGKVVSPLGGWTVHQRPTVSAEQQRANRMARNARYKAKLRARKAA